MAAQLILGPCSADYYRNSDGAVSIGLRSPIAQFRRVRRPNAGTDRFLWCEPAVQETVKLLREGLPDDKGTCIRVNPEEMEKLGIKEARKTVRDLFERFIENDEITTKSGKMLGVDTRKSKDDHDVVYIAGREWMISHGFCQRRRKRLSKEEKQAASPAGTVA